MSSDKVKIVLNLRDRRKRFISRRETLKQKIADRVGLDPDAFQLESLNWETKKWEVVEPNDLKDKDEIRVADLEKILKDLRKDGDVPDSCDGTLSSSDEEKCMKLRKKLRKNEELTDSERFFICNILWCRERIPGISTRGADSVQDKETQTSNGNAVPIPNILDKSTENRCTDRYGNHKRSRNIMGENDVRNGDDDDSSHQRARGSLENGDTDDDDSDLPGRSAKKKKLDDEVRDEKQSRSQATSKGIDETKGKGKVPQRRRVLSESDESSVEENKLKESAKDLVAEEEKERNKNNQDAKPEPRKRGRPRKLQPKPKSAQDDTPKTKQKIKSRDFLDSAAEEENPKDFESRKGKARRCVTKKERAQKSSNLSDSEEDTDKEWNAAQGRTRKSTAAKKDLKEKDSNSKKLGSGSSDSDWEPDEEDHGRSNYTRSGRSRKSARGSSEEDSVDSSGGSGDWKMYDTKSKKRSGKKSSGKKSEVSSKAPPGKRGRKKDAIAEKRDQMQVELKRDQPDYELLKDLMDDTFVARQDYILYDTPSIKDVKKAYPALFDVKEVIREFGRIKDRDLFENYKKNLLKYASVIIENAPSSSSSTISQIVQDSISKAKTDEETDYLKSAAVVLLLPTYLDESAEKFIFFEKSSKDAFPLIVCTEPLEEIFSTKTNFVILVEMLKLCETKDLLEAFFAFIASFYIFSIEFPAACIKTIAVVESLFIEVEPELFPAQSREVKKLIVSKWEEKKQK